MLHSPRTLALALAATASWHATYSCAATFNVASADDIENAMALAQPGDTLVMADGFWTNQEIDFAGIGTSANPITLRPQTPGGVVLNGTSRLRISGDHLVVDGLHFQGGTIENSDHVVQFRGPLGEATNSRFTNSVIQSYNPIDLTDKYHYVSLYGQNNRVDHNTFLDQQNIGAQVVAWLDESSSPIQALHQIDSNHFGDRPEGWDNGFETIRLGDSGTSLQSAQIVVENNLFERSDGEIEIISNKSGDNVFRYNTFRESKGTLTLRHGNAATVEGNFFLGEGADGSGGIRVIGEDHRIINNYIADVDDRADGAISFAAGIPNTPLNGYARVKNVVVAHNTIVNANGAGITFDWGLGTRDRSLLPEDLTIVGNIISNAGGVSFEGNEGTGYLFADNIADGAPLGITPRAGISEVDPQLIQDADGLWRPAPTSPAIDGTSATATYVTDDMDGQPRIGLFDIGSDELSPAQIARKPLTTADVGASWFGYQEPDDWGGPPPLPEGDYVVIEAEQVSSITDPDNDGSVWSVASIAEASGGQVLKSPPGGRSDSDAHDTLALYDIAFAQAGDYTAYYLARGFSGSSDSFFTPTDFATDPTVTENITSGGSFSWETGEVFGITQTHVGVPLEFRLGRREGLAEIDTILFHQNANLTPTQLSILLATPPVGLLGDVDGDGDLDLQDIDLLAANFGLAAPSETQGDLDGDGDVDLEDLRVLVEDLIGTVMGDANLDYATNTSDLAILASNFGATANSWGAADFNGDGFVNTGDLAILAGGFGASVATANATSAPVPEPASMALLACGLGLATARRRAAFALS
ncbi:MAG: chondroitinase-B domain-containing protein [Planctomycetota bacterium]